MKYQQLLAVPMLGLALVSVDAYATGGNPTFPNLPTISNFPTPLNIGDWSFDTAGLEATLTQSGINYQLHVYGTGSPQGTGVSTFYGPDSDGTYNIAGTTYDLYAMFNASGAFVSDSSNRLTISGTSVTSSLNGVVTTLPSTNPLLDAQVTDFGYDLGTGTLAFKTTFDPLSPSWAVTNYSGGSTGESVFLFNEIALDYGFGGFTALTQAIAGGSLAGLDPGTTYSGIRSVTAVPLPLPAVLFGSGLTAMLGVARKRRAV